MEPELTAGSDIETGDLVYFDSDGRVRIDPELEAQREAEKLTDDDLHRRRMTYREYLAEKAIPCDDDAVCDEVVDYMMTIDRDFPWWSLGRSTRDRMNREAIEMIEMIDNAQRTGDDGIAALLDEAKQLGISVIPEPPQS